METITCLSRYSYSPITPASERSEKQVRNRGRNNCVSTGSRMPRIWLLDSVLRIAGIKYGHTVILDGHHGQRELQISICRRKPRARFRQHGRISSGPREEEGPFATYRGCAPVG